VPRDICAGCRRPILSGEETLELADDNRVHIDNDYQCLIAWGRRWRAAARAAVAATVANALANPDITTRQADCAFSCPQPVPDTDTPLTP
jgi:hypothetical protein